MYPSSSSAYDRAITVFSPDGRLFQVEYAREAVKRGTTAIGMVYGEGGLLATDKNISSRLVNADSIEKIFKIDDHVGAATSGLVADARRLIHFSRIEAQREKVAYNEPVGIDALVKAVCDLKQSYTQYGGSRPFGTSLLVMGAGDQGPQLFETDPSGAFSEVYAAAIGSGKKEAEATFEKQYNNDASFEDAVKLAYKILKQTGDKNTSANTIALSYVDSKEKMFTELSTEELKAIVGKKG